MRYVKIVEFLRDGHGHGTVRSEGERVMWLGFTMRVKCSGSLSSDRDSETIEAWRECVCVCVGVCVVCLRVCTCVCVCARPCSFFNVHVRVSACPSSSRRVLCSRRRDFYQHTHVLALPLHGGGPFISNTYVYVYMHVCMHAYHFLSLFNSINFCLTFNYSYFLHYSS